MVANEVDRDTVELDEGVDGGAAGVDVDTSSMDGWRMESSEDVS